ncbi:hypothetical protein CCACVL1_00430, partial [Corchorus capsularis]
VPPLSLFGIHKPFQPTVKISSNMFLNSFET